MSFPAGFERSERGVRRTSTSSATTSPTRTPWASRARSAQFADVYANSLLGAGGNAIGIGTKVADGRAAVHAGQHHASTNNPLDIAINGSGFFRMSDNGTITYTRNGQFQLDKDGYIVNADGLHADRLSASTPTGNIVPSSPVPICSSPTADIAPQATTELRRRR